MKIKLFFNWSTGKDSALSLYHLLKNPDYSVDHLLTTVNSHYDRVSMHGLRRELFEQQVQSIGIPSSTVELPEQPDMDTYEKIMGEEIVKLKSKGFTHAAFGDIFLEDLKKYREDQFDMFNIQTIFPIWKRDTRELISEFLALGFKAVIIASKAEFFDSSFLGRQLDENLIKDFPPKVDPCGENGEFHTFCYDGPIFKHPVAFEIGEKIYKEYKAPKRDERNDGQNKMGFWFCDLLPK